MMSRKQRLTVRSLNIAVPTHDLRAVIRSLVESHNVSILLNRPL